MATLELQGDLRCAQAVHPGQRPARDRQDPVGGARCDDQAGVRQACDAAFMQGVQLPGLGVPHQRVGAVVDALAQFIHGLVQGAGLVRFEAIELGRRAREVGRLTPVDLPAAACRFVQQDRVHAMGNQGLRSADAGGAGADDGDGVHGHLVGDGWGSVELLMPPSRAGSLPQWGCGDAGSSVGASLLAKRPPLPKSFIPCAPVRG
jgi:hypothetical protein